MSGQTAPIEEDPALPFRSIIDAADDGVAIIEAVGTAGEATDHYEWRFVNRRGRQILEVDGIALGGTDVELTAPGLVRHGILQNCALSARAGSGDGEVHGKWLSSDGRVLAARARMFGPFMILTFRDVTLAEQLERSERTTRLRLGDILASISDGFIVLDADWRFSYVNVEAGRLLRRSPDRLLGCNLWEELPHLGSSAFHQNLHRASADGVAVAFESPGELDSEVWYSVRAYPSDVGLTIYFRDVTVERHVAMQAAEVERVNSLVTLAGGVAHDFNNLLTVLNGHAAILAERLGPAHPGMPQLEAIRSSAGRAEGLTRQLLAYSQHQMVLPTPVDLNLLVDAVRGQLLDRAGAGITIDFEFEEDPVTVDVDHRQLVQCLLDLVDNAHDAMPNGGRLTIGVSRAPGSGARSEPPGTLGFGVICVSDEGVGMSEEIRTRATEPFFTHGGTGHRTGLGLSAADGMVKQAGGRLDLESASGAGTVVRITLPLCADSCADSAAAEAPAAEAPAAELPDERPDEASILVVDDNASIRDLLARLLSDQGYVVEAAADCASAIERASARARPFDLLITDVLMPGQTGFELAEVLAASSTGPAVLFMSGFTDHPELSRAPAATLHAFITKPFSATEILGQVRRLLAEQAVMRGGTNDAG
ncbi:MAG: Blue-light-activated protein [Acidimicrobiales bacterium]|nr:Blue-light-activated protein [Acidimicrobiales bacterium]